MLPDSSVPTQAVLNHVLCSMGIATWTNEWEIVLSICACVGIHLLVVVLLSVATILAYELGAVYCWWCCSWCPPYSAISSFPSLPLSLTQLARFSLSSPFLCWWSLLVYSVDFHSLTCFGRFACSFSPPMIKESSCLSSFLTSSTLWNEQHRISYIFVLVVCNEHLPNIAPLLEPNP